MENITKSNSYFLFRSVSPQGKPKDSNFIPTPWEILPQDKQIEIRGRIHQYMTEDLVSKTNAPNPNPSKPNAKKIHLPKLIQEIKPNLKGPELGQTIKQVNQWMKENNIEQTEENETRIREYISKL